jgi:hypothetical protein
MAESSFQEYKSPTRKLARFFHSSRDRWKAKHHEAKKNIKRLTNQQRAVEQSRQVWRTRAEEAEHRVEQLEQSIEALK